KLRTYVILDAFDECRDDTKRELSETVDLLLSQYDRVYIFITSRPNSKLEEIASSSPNETRTINIIAGEGAQTQDLKFYLDGKLAKERISVEEKLFIAKGILEK